MATLDPIARANEAERIRVAAAAAERVVSHHPTNGDEARYPGKWGNYSKGLAHDSRGDVVLASYDSLIHALLTGLPADFENIQLGGNVPLVDPQSGLAYDLQGADCQSLTMKAPPALASAERGGEAVEDYWMAVLRDVPFTHYDSHPLAQAAIDDLNKLSDFRGPKESGQVTAQTLFRGFTPGDLIGPYVSQFLVLPFDFGALHVDQQFQTFLPVTEGGKDYLTGFGAWLAVQNGQATDPSSLRGLPFGSNQFGKRLYLHDGRGIAAYVHVDVLFEAYFNACLIAIDQGAPFNPGNPYNSTPKEEGFGTFGTPYAKTQVATVASPALKAVWYQKWFVHRVLRPEAYGGLVQKTMAGASDPNHFAYPVHADVLNSDAVARIASANGTNLLPQAFPEGCPWHPSYGQGHGTVAGACATMLKAVFDENWVIPSPMVATDDGTSLRPYAGADQGQITLGVEANKLAANIALGRNHAGVHWRSDYREAVLLGEEVAIRVLEDQKATYNEIVSWTFTKFDGTKITISEAPANVQMPDRFVSSAARCIVACALLLTMARLAHPQAPLNERVLVVYNAEVRESKEVASYYMAKRAIPLRNTCKISVSRDDTIQQGEFDSKVKRPIRKCLEELGKSNILYIVFSYRTPFVLAIGPKIYALDQFVADIWDEYLPERAANIPEVQPYFGGAQSEGDLYQPYVSLASYRAGSNARRIYSVWRLDAASAAVAKGLVDKALYAEANGLSGNACFDRRYDPLTGVADFSYGAGDWDIHQAAEMARRAGFTVIEDGHAAEFGTPPAPLRCDHAALYAGWYSLEHYNDAFTWNPGAIGIHLDSNSATNPRSGRSWAANALAHGITVTAGAMEEPYLDNLPHPDQALWYLLHGANVGDALLRSERLLKWMILNIGDPLYRPFPKGGDLAERVKPAMVFALLPQLTLGDSTSGAVIALSKVVSGTGVDFAVKTDRPDLVSIPPMVTIRLGADGTKFPIHTGHVSGDGTTARVFVATRGLQKSNTLVLFSLLGSLSLSANTVKRASPVTGLVVLRRAAPAGGTAVTLKSGNPAAASVAAELKIPEGQSKATFPITIHGVASATAVAISASYEGMVRNVTLTVLP